MGGKRVGSDPVVEHLSLPSVVQDTELGGTLARPALGQLHMEPQRGNHSLTRLEGGDNTVLCCPEYQTDDEGMELLRAASFGFLFSASL